MSDISDQWKQCLEANPKLVEVAREIARDHAEEIKRILVEGRGDPVKIFGRLHRLVRREAPRDDTGPVPAPHPTPTPDPTKGPPDDDDDPVGEQILISVVLIVGIILAW
jgi:hypothetical protein